MDYCSRLCYGLLFSTIFVLLFVIVLSAQCPGYEDEKRGYYQQDPSKTECIAELS